MLKVILLPGAEIDYCKALTWYFEQSLSTAAAFETAIEVALTKLSETATFHPFFDERHQFYILYILRRFPFSFVYRVENEAVVVVAIAHSSREAGYWRRK